MAGITFKRAQWGAGGLAAALALLGCAELPAPPSKAPELSAAPKVAQVERPQPRPESGALRSETSKALSASYQRQMARLRATGHLRRDLAPSDAPFTDTMLARNFERIALYNEYTRENGSFRPSQGTSPLRRWEGPIQFELVQGPQLSPAAAERDRKALASLLARISPLTSGRSLSLAQKGQGNFLVLTLSEDERRAEESRLRRFVPGIDRASLQALLNPPPGIKCLVIAFSDAGTPVYKRAVAMVRAELPDEMREACLHEEVVQGLGLANDHPNVRPSIFNDDEEFMLLTAHDALLLKILYDPRLRAGMTIDEAEPIVRQIATELLDPAPV